MLFWIFIGFVCFVLYSGDALINYLNSDPDSDDPPEMDDE